MFEEQYTELATAVDEIAERIRTLGVKAPGSYSAFCGAVVDRRRPAASESAEDMIRELVLGQEAVARTAREAFPAADDANDEPTCRPADAAYADPREKRLDASQHAGLK